MHRPGIGPGPPPWQGEILPLDQRFSLIQKILLFNKNYSNNRVYKYYLLPKVLVDTFLLC